MPSARAEYESVYGRIVSDWKTTADGSFSLRITIPANTSAKVVLPAIDRGQNPGVQNSGAHVSENGNPVNAQVEAGSYVVRVGSGTYDFQVSR
jgi:alpha-L-rhamnosidase